MGIFKKNEPEETELIMGVEQVNKEALAELCNGLGEDEDVEKLMKDFFKDLRNKKS